MTQPRSAAPTDRRGLLQIDRDELPGLVWSFLYFFAVLAGYYVLRPIREQMGVRSGPETLQYLFSASFIIMLAVVLPLYGWIVSRIPRRVFVPWVYWFFVLNLIGFFFAFGAFGESVWIGRVFFVWVAVFNLFVVAVFWSFMADLFDSDQAARMFGIIAAGGSAGAITGPLLTGLLVGTIGVRGLCLVSASLLVFAIYCIRRLMQWHGTAAPESIHDVASSRAIGGSIWAGATRIMSSRYLQLMAGLTALGTFSGALMYYQQAFIVREAIADPLDQTRYFALIDWLTNVGTILIEVFLVSRLLRWFDVAGTLLIPAVIAVVGLVALGLVMMTESVNAIWVLAPLMVLRRATGFGIVSPVSNMLYTVVDAESKYKAKHFIDTGIYRLGDFASGWTFRGLMVLGVGLGPIALLGAGLGVVWAVVAVKLGHGFEQRRDRLLPAT